MLPADRPWSVAAVRDLVARSQALTDTGAYADIKAVFSMLDESVAFGSAGRPTIDPATAPEMVAESAGFVRRLCATVH